MRDYYRHLRAQYGMTKVAALVEIVKAWISGDIDNRK